MTVNRLDWSTAALGARVVPVLTIAGAPYAFTPPGVDLTDVVWTGDPDSAWFLGTSSIVARDWLRLDEIAIETTARLPGEAPDVSGLTAHLADVDGAVTSYVGGRRAMARTLLTANLTASATSVSVERTDGFPSTGALHIGGERVTYTGKTSTTFTGLTRGTAGTRARRHVLRQGMFALEVFGGSTERLPGLRGRRACLWLCRLTGATTATDPTLVWDGVCGAGGEVGAGWRVPLVPSVRALEAKLTTQQVTLAGYSHEEAPGSRGASAQIAAAEASPVAAYWNGYNLLLTSDTATPDNDGWHATRESYVQALQVAAQGAGVGLAVYLSGTRLGIHASTVTDQLVVTTPWTAERTYYLPDRESTDSDISFVADGMPEVCCWAAGRIHLASIDLAVVPSPPSVTAGTTHTQAWWTLAAECADGKVRSGRIDTVDASTVTVLPTTFSASWRTEYLVLRRTAATIGLHAQSDVWWDAIRYGVLGTIDSYQGTGTLSDTVAWEEVASVATAYAAALPPRRRYTIDEERAFIELLTAEGAANGLSLVQRKGRLSFIRQRDVALTEPTTATLTLSDLGPEPPRPRWTSQGLASVYEWTLPDKTRVRVLDAAAEDESGQGKTIKATLPEGAFDGAAAIRGPALVQAFESIGSQVLGPIRQEYQEVTLTLPLRWAGLEVGDTVRVTDYLTPPGDGTRGLDGAALQITGKALRLSYRDGTGTVELTARVSDPTLVGYAPEAPVNAGGIAAGSAVVQIDDITLGSDGWAGDGRGVLDGFSVGDKVLLVRFDSTTYTTLARTIASIDLVATPPTVTFTATVPFPWDSYSAGSLGVILAYDVYANATNTGDPAQHAYAFIAESGSLLDGTDTPKRYAP